MLPPIRPTMTAAAAARPAARRGAFAVPLPDAAALPGSAPMAAAAAVAAGLLGLQEASPDPLPDAKLLDHAACRHGGAMLDGVTALQRALLAVDGAAEAADGALRRLAKLADAVPVAADPALRRLLAAVTLRARVELARRRG